MKTNISKLKAEKIAAKSVEQDSEKIDETAQTTKLAEKHLAE